MGDLLIYEVAACAKVGKLLPDGWTKQDESVESVSVSEVSSLGQSMSYFHSSTR